MDPGRTEDRASQGERPRSWEKIIAIKMMSVFHEIQEMSKGVAVYVVS